MIKKFILVVMFICAPLCVIADSDSEAATTVPTLYCPDASQLTKDPLTNTWHAGPEYKSDPQPFATSIDHFAGAQWSGIEVGQVACVYAPAQATFPVILYYNKLTMKPSKALWGKDQGGLVECKSFDPKNCPYQPRLKHEVKDIYQDALNIGRSTD